MNEGLEQLFERAERITRTKKRKPILAIDFDGTIVTHKFPKMGDLQPGVVEVIQRLHAFSEIVIWTCRHGKGLEEMRHFLVFNSIPFDGVNENGKSIGVSIPGPKIFYDLLIDDRALGFVPNWDFLARGILNYLINDYGRVNDFVVVEEDQ